MTLQPEPAKSLIVRVPAFRARPMAGGKRCRFIEKEQFGISTRLHHLAISSAELEQARDPAPHLPRPDDPPRIIVQDASVAHHQTTAFKCDDFTERCDPVL